MNVCHHNCVEQLDDGDAVLRLEYVRKSNCGCRHCYCHRLHEFLHHSLHDHLANWMEHPPSSHCRSKESPRSIMLSAIH
jgi:hypothetical protein